MITVEEMCRIRDAADAKHDAAITWAAHAIADADSNLTAEARVNLDAARRDFIAALDAVTDYSPTPALVGKDATT